MNLNSNYWNKRYLDKDIGWDTGNITTPLKEYINQVSDKSLKILIPGCGNGYEFDYLISRGFTNCFVVDYAESPIVNLKKKFPLHGDHKIIQQDFFEHEGQYDLIIEQTFFCALAPELRKRYVEKMHSLLNRKGKLAGLFFQFPLNNSKTPPFGGSKEEYLKLFSENFEIKILETAYNSIKPRQGNELFFIFTKK